MVTEVLSSMLPFAVGLVASPIPVIAIAVVFSTNAANSAGFLLGWGPRVAHLNGFGMFNLGCGSSSIASRTELPASRTTSSAVDAASRNASSAIAT